MGAECEGISPPNNGRAEKRSFLSYNQVEEREPVIQADESFMQGV
jgi:hypothetical protein